MSAEHTSHEYEHDHGPIAWMAKNSVAANLLMIVFLLGGFIFATQVKQEVFPEFATDIIQISVPYPGASPEEVEQGILLSIEDGVRGLEGVKRVTSTASESNGNLMIELLTSANPNKVLQDVKNQVDRISSFPEDAERPVVSLLESRKTVVTLIVYGDQDQRLLRDFAERVRDDLVMRPGVTFVELGLAPSPEIGIEIPLATLRAYGLTLEQVAQKIRSSALELPGGTVKTEAGQILLRTQERRDFGLEYKDIPVTTSADGAVVTLGTIANINDYFEESDKEAEFNKHPAVLVNVYRVGDETPQQVSAAVQKYIEDIQSHIPDNVGLKIWRDTSVIYQDRMNLLLKNAVLGLTLVLLMLGLFLEVRLAFWVTLGIPISVLGSFLFMPFTDASINMISLFAFIITLGIVVDDAVVMGENIYEKKERGFPPLKAAIEGARQIAGPVTFAVLTNIVAFFPLFFVPGISGKFFRQIPAVVVAVFIVSLIESIFILPSHLGHIRGTSKFWKKLNKPRDRCAVHLQNFINNWYAPAIDKIIEFRYLTFSVAVATLIIAAGVVFGGHIRFSFIPKIDSDHVTAQATLPFGAPIEESRKLRERMIDAAKRVLDQNGGQEKTKGLYAQIGGSLGNFGPGPSHASVGGSHLVAVQLSLVNSAYRDFSSVDFARMWRKEIGPVVGLESLVFKAETGASEGAAIEYNLSHRSRESLEAAATEFREIIEGYSGVTDTDDGVSTGKQQIDFKISPQAESLGVTAASLGRQVRSAFYGAEALRQQRGRNEVRVMVRLPESERATLDTVEQLVIRTPQGGELPLTQAAEIIEGRSYTQINRRDGRRIITVTGDVDELVSNSNQINQDILANDLPILAAKYPGLQFSFGGEREAQSESLGALGVGFLISMLVIFTLLAVPFKSYAQPIIVMLSIPFGFIGAVIGHVILGYGLSIVSMFGLIALSGVVVNDSLVLVVTANRFRQDEGVPAIQAVKRAGIRRFRSVTLTSLTTFFGLAPMIFETSVQARFLIPMAISIGFGILFATVITLALVPSVYMILEDIKAWGGRMHLKMKPARS